MKICLLNNLYKPYNRGGAERIVEMYFEELQRRGHEVFIITTEPYGKGASEKNVFYIKSLYFNLNRIPLVLRLFWHIWDFFDFISAYKIGKILRKNKIDVVITHNMKGLSFLSLVVFKILNIRHVHVLHDVQLLHPSGLMNYGEEFRLDIFFAKLYQFICSFFFSFTEAVISPSEWLLLEHRKRNFFQDSKCFTMLNPFEKQYNTPKIGFSSDNPFVFLYVGQLEKHKGVFFLLDVFRKLSMQNVILNIVGSGAGDDVAEEFAAENIKFLGRKNKHEVACEMRNANCLIMPSLCYENSPTVIYEACSLGLPVLGSDIGGSGELIQKFGGILFHTNSVDNLSKQIKWCVDNREELQRIGSVAMQAINQNDKDKYFDFVEGLLG